MLDFVTIQARPGKRGVAEIYPEFKVGKSNDLMIRGGDFYAIWIEELGLWSTDEDDVIQLIDKELTTFAEEYKTKFDGEVKVLRMRNASSGLIDSWHKYCQKQSRDNFHMLDEKLIFANTKPKKRDHASKRLPYPLEEGECKAFDTLMSTLYSEEERKKIEWAIGSIVTGDSKTIQKFMVLYGSAGTGKSTVLNIIQQLFEGYYSVFDAKALGSATNVFALEAFKTNPLVAIQHDGDLSKIEDNTRLNSLVSHELMTMNEKFKSTYPVRFKSFLFMGTNKPVKITDAKSGLIRRLIDVTPSGNKLDPKEYRRIMKQITFELGAIAYHCKEVYLNDPGAYDDYIPSAMMGATNDFYNFIIDSYHIFKKDDGTTLKAAWEMYKTYCDEARVPYPFSQKTFKEELKNYFYEYNDRFNMDGARVRSYYSGFRTDKFETAMDVEEEKKEPINYHIDFNHTKSIFDEVCAECPAQYTKSDGTPKNSWDYVTTKLSDIDTSKLHYVRGMPENHIIIDFDIPDENGNKDFARNLEEASKWPATYAELSKSGAGIHLHYIYTGDVSRLDNKYADHIEIKVFNGKSSLRRKLTKCNNLPISNISSGLPLKGEKMISDEVIKSEKGLREMIKRNLNKEFHPGTKPSIDFIHTILEDAYARGLKYDVSDMYNDIFAFAASSTNKADYCIKLVSKMKFKSDEPSDFVEANDAPIVFYDIEVFPNLFLVNWKYQGKDKPVVRMINPTSAEIEELLRYRLVGFNCRRYDNHILYARLMGYSNEKLYQLSQDIINGSRRAFFGEAYNLSYTDVYDFAAKKQSLKKWEIELGIHHQELGLPWDQPVPEERWIEVAEYCDNDVIATEAVFDHLSADFMARQILADLAGMSVNDTTNSLSTRFIFGTNRKPQDQFNYRDMGDISAIEGRSTITPDMVLYDNFGSDDFTVFDKKERPIFPGYKFEAGKSTYRGEDVGEGGYVYSEPGMYSNVALLDIASMHPSSIIAEELFGPTYTARFKEILDARLAIKHKDFEAAKKMLNGALAKYLKDESSAKALAQALKIVINSIYGLTAANFDNPFRDSRNKDNIVAKRGALFMINLKYEVQKRGFTVAHVKTDSIKVPDATPEIIEYIMDYGKMYGYTFEHEATYEKMCLVNDAVYIAKDKATSEWSATGAQFAVPYVFKTLFSKEPIEFDDMCETKSVTSALYLDMNENLPEDEHEYQFVGKIGRFCPIKPGFGGGVLLRSKDDKYYAATGSKGYRWLESERVQREERENDIDRSYYDALVDDAVATISKYGDFDWFASDEPVPLKIDNLPWTLPCGDEEHDTCLTCPHLNKETLECGLGYITNLKGE